MKVRDRQTGAVYKARLTLDHPASKGGIPVLVLPNGDAIAPAAWGTRYEPAEVNPRYAAALRAAGYGV